MGRRLPRAMLCVAVLVIGWTGSALADDPTGEGPASRWCAPELEAVTSSVCFYEPDATEPKAVLPEPPRTLVIFLHSLVGDGSAFAWQQQRLIRRHAERWGFSVLVPRGRPAFGPGRDPKVIAWPTARALQEAHEEELLAEWARARELVEAKRSGFDRTYVLGFSNGGYYATSLALRGKLDVDGYGVFAGGSGGRYHRLLARGASRRVPLFVGYGTKDPEHPRQEALVALLEELGWPHGFRADRIGHTVSDAQIREAMAFLGGGVPTER